MKVRKKIKAEAEVKANAKAEAKVMLMSQTYVSFELMYLSEEDKIMINSEAKDIIEEANRLIKSVENR